jgi:hypothetical protein
MTVRQAKETAYHGLSRPCTSCSVWGRVDHSPSDDGPEFEDWIGRSGGKEVCHACYNNSEDDA